MDPSPVTCHPSRFLSPLLWLIRRSRRRATLTLRSRLPGLAHLRLLRLLPLLRDLLRLSRGRGHVNRVRLVDRLLEPFDRLPQPFAKLGNLARAENDQHDNQDQQQLHPAERPEHVPSWQAASSEQRVALSYWLFAARCVLHVNSPTSGQGKATHRAEDGAEAIEVSRNSQDIS